MPGQGNYMSALRAARRLAIYLTDQPLRLFALFFIFLVARNWRVFALADVYDGYIVKASIVSHGFSLAGIKYYVHHYVLRSYDQHFIPVWFAIFFVLAYLFDSNPYVLGLISFGLAACLLTLVYYIVLHFAGHSVRARPYALLAVVLFSGTPFFLETIAWKWQSALLLSTVCFCAALLLMLKNITGRRWLVFYGVLLGVCYWTFGTGWVGGWGLLLYLWLKDRRSSARVVITGAITCIGTVLAVVMNHGAIPLNPLFLLTEFPSMAALTTANIVLTLGGFLRYDAVDHTHLSTVTGLTMLALMLYYCGPRYLQRRLREKDMLTCGLIIVYLGLILLSLFRLTPASGLAPAGNPGDYLFGNRYLFIFSTPLYLALAINLKAYVLKLRREVVVVLFAAALLIGISVASVYPQLDPAMTNTKRTEFYNLTMPALRYASAHKLVLPDVTGDLYFPGSSLPLDQAAAMRKSSSDYPVRFVASTKITTKQCSEVRQNKLITKWLNDYSTDWCKNKLV